MTRAGPEIGVASTKAFTTQITVLTLMALKLAKAKGSISNSDFHMHLQELETNPNKVEEALKSNEHIQKVAFKYKDARNCLYLGRGFNFPVALEGALKLKEISYIHAEGYPAGEMKHGPIALIDEQLPVVVIAPHNETFEKVAANMEEVQARGGRVVASTDQVETGLADKAETVLVVPQTIDDLMPVLTTIPLPLLSYHIVVPKGPDVDHPRNLAKSLTVE